MVEFCHLICNVYQRKLCFKSNKPKSKLDFQNKGGFTAIWATCGPVELASAVNLSTLQPVLFKIWFGGGMLIKNYVHKNENASTM